MPFSLFIFIQQVRKRNWRGLALFFFVRGSSSLFLVVISFKTFTRIGGICPSIGFNQEAIINFQIYNNLEISRAIIQPIIMYYYRQNLYPSWNFFFFFSLSLRIENSTIRWSSWLVNKKKKKRRLGMPTKSNYLRRAWRMLEYKKWGVLRRNDFFTERERTAGRIRFYPRCNQPLRSSNDTDKRVSSFNLQRQISGSRVIRIQDLTSILHPLPPPRPQPYIDDIRLVRLRGREI